MKIKTKILTRSNLRTGKSKIKSRVLKPKEGSGSQWQEKRRMNFGISTLTK